MDKKLCNLQYDSASHIVFKLIISRVVWHVMFRNNFEKWPVLTVELVLEDLNAVAKIEFHLDPRRSNSSINTVELGRCILDPNAITLLLDKYIFSYYREYFISDMKLHVY